MSMVRLRRLQSDYARIAALIQRHARLQLIQAEGSPPERYQIEYRVKGLRQVDGEIREVNSHLVEIHLPRDYPRTPPLCRMLTPVFHPNIAPHAICIGDHWSAGEALAALVVRIGEMLAYQSYNTKSPLNGEAAKWTEQNLDRLPVDPVNMQLELPADASAGSAALPVPVAAGREPPPQAIASAAAADTIPSLHTGPPTAAREVRCTGCAARLRVRPDQGARVRCPRCREAITVEW